MKNLYLLLSLILLGFHGVNAQGTLTSQKCFGGTKSDDVFKILPTDDGGYIMFGYASSSDDDVTGLHGTHYADIWVAKVNSSNTIEWSKCLGGTGQEEPSDIIALREGGFLIAGITNSTDGDVTQSFGNYDAWVAKLDDHANIRWQKSFGGSGGDDNFIGVLQNKAGHYIFSGHTASTDNGITGNHGSADGWIMELDTFGTMQWQYCYGGVGYDQFTRGPVQDANGNYYFAGAADSGVSGNHGDVDMWVLKTDASGHMLKQKCFGGSSPEYAFAIAQLSNGHIALVGGAGSSDGDVTHSFGNGDGWVVTIDTSLNMLWQTSIGSGGFEQLTSVAELNGQIVVSGTTDSNDGNIGLFNHGDEDIYLATLNLAGTVQKQICYGGTGADEGSSVAVTNNGDIYICARTGSNNGNISGNHGDKDGWVGKTSLVITGIEESNDALQSLSIYPNPTTGSFQIQFTSAEMFTGILQLCNMLGQTVAAKEVTVLNGTNTFTSPTGTGELPKGMYLLRISNNTGSEISRKVMVE